MAQKSRKMLDSLQKNDPDVAHVAVYSKFCVVHYKDDATGKWHQPKIEGPCYLVRRCSIPWYAMVVQNKLQEGDLYDGLDENWEIDSKPNHICYSTGDPDKNVRCFWFAEDAERMKVQVAFEIAVNRYKTGKVGPLETIHTGKKKKADLKDGEENAKDETAGDLFKQFGIKAQEVKEGGQQTRVTQPSLAMGLKDLAFNEHFLNMQWSRFVQFYDPKQLAMVTSDT